MNSSHYLFQKLLGKESAVQPLSGLLLFWFNLFIFMFLVIYGSANSLASYPSNNNHKQVVEADTSVVQQSSQYVRFILTDGTTIIAKIDSIKNETYFVRTPADISMTIPLSKIKDIQKLRGEVVGGEYRRFDPNRTRLLFAPTARALDAGEGYFSAYEIFFPMLTLGITNFMAISAGVSLFPGATNQVVYGNLKIVPFQSNEFSFACGALAVSIEEFNGGIVYGCGTYGSNNHSLTFGIGFPYAKWKTSRNPIILLGGDIRVGNSIKFVTENWIFTASEGEVLFSLGLRLFGDNLAADFGLFSISEMFKEGGFPFSPWLGFAYNFGGK